MSLVCSMDEISAYKERFSNGFALGDIVVVMALFRTKADVIKRVLPPPLEPAPEPIGIAYVAEYHKTNFGVTYNEAALFILAQYKGEVGNYCLSMPVTNDMALIGGRELYGYPKKIAETIRVERTGNKATGICVRRGVPIIEIKVNLTGPADPEALPRMPCVYLFRYLADPRLDRFQYGPRLLRQRNETKQGKTELGQGELILAKSKHDPIYEIPVEEVLMAAYTEGSEVLMKPCEVIAEVDPMKFMPYSFINSDWLL